MSVMSCQFQDIDMHSEMSGLNQKKATMVVLQKSMKSSWFQDIDMHFEIKKGYGNSLAMQNQKKVMFYWFQDIDNIQFPEGLVKI